MSGFPTSADRWPLAVSGTGLLLAAVLAIERILLLTDVVSVPVLYHAGVATSLPFILGLVYAGYWLAGSDLSAERYPRVFAWLVGVLIGFSLLINGIVLTMERGAWHLSATRWAASLGGCVGVIMGVLEAYMIESRHNAEQVRTQKQTLERQYDRIKRHQTLQSTLRNVIIELSDRARLEDAVCTELAGESTPLVCCCEPTPAGDVTVRTGAGRLADHEPVLTALTSEDAPVTDTLTDGDPAVLRLDEVDAPWTDDPRAAGIRALTTAPLTYDGVNYGVLAVCAGDPADDAAADQQLVADVAETLAYGIHTTEQEAVLRSDRPVRVTLGVWDEDSYLCALAADDRFPAEKRLSVVETGSTSPETATHHFVVEPGDDGTGDRLLTVLPALDGVRSIESRSDPGQAGDVVATAQVERPTLGDMIVRCSGTVQAITVTSGAVHVVAEFAADADLSSVLERARERLDTVRFVSKTQVDPGDGVSRQRVDELLTEKQREALEAAYLNGFFDRPQRKTAEEIADLLGVSRSTFLSHVRAAEATILGEYVTQEAEAPPAITGPNR
ncbi:MAG: helix-turn-helix domain-containing protein [Halobacteriales archaeon]